jgi:DNA-binding NarL/FixJ family response regulator
MIPLSKVLIAHTEQFYCEGLEIQKAYSADHAVELLHKTEFNILALEDVLTDNGIHEFVRILKVKHPKLSVIIITRSTDADYINNLRRPGISGLVHGNATCKSMKACIDAVAAGNINFCPTISNIIGGKVTEQAYKENNPEAYFELTRREFEFFKLKVKRFSMKKIMQEMKISMETARQYRSNVMHKVREKGYEDVLDFVLKTGYYTALMELPYLPEVKTAFTILCLRNVGEC